MTLAAAFRSRPNRGSGHFTAILLRILRNVISFVSYL